MLRPFASGERRRTASKKAERLAPPTGVGAWLERAEQAMRVQNSKPVKITCWHFAAWAVLAVLLGLLVFGH